MQLRKLSTADLQFPSGRAKSVAGFGITPDAAERRLGLCFDRGDDPGLGPVVYLLLALPSGRGAALQWHEWAPIKLLVLEADHGAERGDLLKEFLEVSGFGRDEVTWEPDVDETSD